LYAVYTAWTWCQTAKGAYLEISSSSKHHREYGSNGALSARATPQRCALACPAGQHDTAHGAACAPVFSGCAPEAVLLPSYMFSRINMLHHTTLVVRLPWTVAPWALCAPWTLRRAPWTQVGRQRVRERHAALREHVRRRRGLGRARQTRSARVFIDALCPY
jgi:hypothetical protein